MNTTEAFVAGAVFDGETTRHETAVIVTNGRIVSVVAASDLPAGLPVVDLGPHLLAPGLVDLQVNGGGGVNFNDAPTPETIGRICRAHAAFGVTSVLVTLITASRATTRAAIEAAVNATGTPGFAGLHLEGPHLSVEKRGAHVADLVRPMADADLGELLAAAGKLPLLMVTVAPESVTADQIVAMRNAGVVLSLGHTAADHLAFRAAVDAGAHLATHLFCAMSGLHHRAPGAVGAILDDGRVWAGLIPDGLHVAPEAVRLAIRAKQGPGRIFAVSDAMATVGSDMDGFELDGRPVSRRGGALRLADGTLAGADIDLAAAMRFLVREGGIDREEALRMVMCYPAGAIGREDEIGRLVPGARADFAVLDETLAVRSVWIAGVRVTAPPESGMGTADE